MDEALATATVTREQIEARSENSAEIAILPPRAGQPRTLSSTRRLYRVRRNI
jgi:hypothetical protein